MRSLPLAILYPPPMMKRRGGTRKKRKRERNRNQHLASMAMRACPMRRRRHHHRHHRLHRSRARGETCRGSHLGDIPPVTHPDNPATTTTMHPPPHSKNANDPHQLTHCHLHPKPIDCCAQSLPIPDQYSLSVSLPRPQSSPLPVTTRTSYSMPNRLLPPPCSGEI